ncbi:transposase [Rhizobium leguminosarum]
MSVKEEMERQFGSKTLDRLIKAREFFDALDAMTEAFQALKARVEVLEARGTEYVGAWQRALAYRRGMVATADGGMWVALRDTVAGEQPGKVLDAWQLSAKAARPVVRVKTSREE